MIRIHIEGLFGHFDYDFFLNEKGINIITGPNGFGKSTIIRCIEAMHKSDIKFFIDLIFEKIEVINQETDEKIVLEKLEDGMCINGFKFSYMLLARLTRGLNIKVVEEDKHIKEMLRMQERFQDITRQMSIMFGYVKLISEQRLLQEGVEKQVRVLGSQRVTEKSNTETVEMIPYKYKRIISLVEGNYSRVSNELDSTFPQRLFNQEEGIAEDEFVDKLRDMQEKVEKLNRYGISSVREPSNIRFRPEDARALKVYFEDFQQKYKEYSDFLERLELFNEIVNNRFRFKKIKTLLDGSFLVKDEETKREINLSKLSSGEKEILVLFFDLLFEVEKNTILLIDEPELSLHIAWQRKFIQDLKKIVELKNLTVVIATHSPQMISGNRELQIDLGELYKNGFNKRG